MSFSANVYGPSGFLEFLNFFSIEKGRINLGHSFFLRHSDFTKSEELSGILVLI
jgi:hypothetical protein